MKYLIPILLILALSTHAQVSPYSHSVSLMYEVPDTLHALQWYAVIRIDAGTEGFYGSGFSEGSLGLQAKGKSRSIRFEVTKSVSAVLLAKGHQVKESKPGVLEWTCNWQRNQSYRVLITAIVDSSSQCSYYSGYVYLPTNQQWKFIGSYKLDKTIDYLRSPAIVVATFQKSTAMGAEKLTVQEAWLQRANGSWKELEDARYNSNEANGRAGIENGNLFLAGRPSLSPAPENGKLLKAIANHARPVIATTNHVDSSAQAKADRQAIYAAIASGKIDTSGSVGGVYYQLLQEGNGAFVAVSDTVTVNYKGSLLKDGSIFDQTKDKPATFPLARLIKGWQYGLTRCKVGGKIRLFIPSGLAYSVRHRSKDIPPNSVLVFDIEVLGRK